MKEKRHSRGNIKGLGDQLGKDGGKREWGNERKQG